MRVLAASLAVSRSVLSLRAARTAIPRSSVRSLSTLGQGGVASQSQSGSRGYGDILLAAGGVVTAGAMVYSTTSKTQLAAHAEAAESDDMSDTALFPQTEPITVGTIKVDKTHTLSYKVYGNPQGKPVLFVHGGPGAGCPPASVRFFDPNAYRIVLVDQRGCGDSTPFASLENNTTWDSVRDFEKIRELLGIEKWMVFGGSWGSTLSLAYAMEHPDRTTELVLRGIFNLRKCEIDWFYQGPGASFLFPEDWAKYEAAIPENERDDYIKAYGRRLRGELGEEEKYKAAKAWSIWEGRTSKLTQDPWDQVKDKFGDDKFALAFARIENHYFTNNGFFPRDGWLLEKAQIDKIRHIPTVIVQGRYDVVCPAKTAYDLSQQFPEARITYTTTGHSAYEPEIIANLVAATEEFKNTK